MKKLLFALTIPVLGIVSCNKEPRQLTKYEINQRIDMLTRVRIRESDEQAKKDLERRMKIELKVKVDSIIHAQAQPKTSSPTPPQAAAVPPIQPPK